MSKISEPKKNTRINLPKEKVYYAIAILEICMELERHIKLKGLTKNNEEKWAVPLGYDKIWKKYLLVKKKLKEDMAEYTEKTWSLDVKDLIKNELEVS